MKDTIGVWSTWVGTWDVFMEDGVFHVEKSSGRGEPLKFKREFGKRFFGDDEFWVGVDYDVLSKFLQECDGMPVTMVEEKASKWVERRRTWQEREERAAAEWQKLRERFGGVVIGVDKEVDVFNTGFNVRVLCNSSTTIDERRACVRAAQKDFLRYVMREVAGNCVAMSRIGDIRFYKPVEIVYLREPEVEVKFEVKEVA